MRPSIATPIALAATVALAVTPASAAAALPEYRTCVRATPRNTGQFDDRRCSQPSAGGAGRYELGAWDRGRKVTLKGQGGPVTLRGYVPESEATPWTGGSSAAVVRCKSAKATGELTGPKTSTLTLELRMCLSEGKRCTSSGAKRGDIVTRPLTATLGYLAGGASVGVDVEASDHGAFAEFECAAIDIVTRGSVIGVVSGDVDTISREGSLTFATNVANGQEVVFGEFPDDPETGAAHYLRTAVTPPGVVLPSSDSITAVLKGEALEIEA